MNQIISIIYFIFFVSAVKSLEETPTPKSEDVNLKSDEVSATDSSVEIKEVYSVLQGTDELLSLSDLNKIYNSLENLFAKTKYLRDQNENKNIEKVEEQVESRVSNKVDAAESLASKSEAKSGAPKKLDVQINPKSGKNEDNVKEESKSAEVTSDKNSFEGTTETYGIEAKSSDLESEKKADDSFTKVTPDEKSGKSGESVMPNDESNTAWDLLDDLPSTRRMLFGPEQLLDIKGKSADENSNLDIVTKAAQPPFVESNRSGARRSNPDTVVPHNHPNAARRGFQIIPGFINSALPVEFRKVVNHENVNTLEKNLDRSESYPERRAEDENHDVTNAYPFTPSEMPQVPRHLPANMVFSKLAQASDHPFRIIPNNNAHILRGFGGMPYILRPNYAVTPVVNMYKYVNGYGRLA